MNALPLTNQQRQGQTEQYAFQWCRDYARSHDENFTVVSWFLPEQLRPHFFSLYAFCRWTDDLGDEAEGDRLRLLDDWERALRDCVRGQRELPLFVALGQTIDRHAIPEDLFLRLIEANRIDQRVTRFETYRDLLDYCSYSATPVGRMVLHILGYRDEALHRLSDATCIGLQLANFWQDVSVDATKGRIYIPLEDIHRFGYSVEDLKRGCFNDAFRALIRFEVGRARRLFDHGRRLELCIDRRARVDVKLFRLGGEAVLDSIEWAGYNVLTRRPRVSKRRKASMALVHGLRMKLGV